MTIAVVTKPWLGLQGGVHGESFPGRSAVMIFSKIGTFSSAGTPSNRYVELPAINRPARVLAASRPDWMR